MSSPGERGREEEEESKAGDSFRNLIISHRRLRKKALQTTTKTKQSEAFSVVVVAQCNVRQFLGMLKQLRCCSVAVAVAVAFAFCSHLHSPLCSHLRSPLRSHAAYCIHLLTLSPCVCIVRSHTLSSPLSHCRRAVVDQLCVCLARGRSLSALRLCCCCCFCCCSFVCFFLRFLCIFTVRCYQNAALQLRCLRRSQSHSRRCGVSPFAVVATSSSQ